MGGEGVGKGMGNGQMNDVSGGHHASCKVHLVKALS